MTHALSDSSTSATARAVGATPAVEKPAVEPRAVEPRAVELSAAAARLARIVELTRLLETAAHMAADRCGAAYLLVDRTGNPDTADIKALVDGDRLVDLWDLDPLLWDDAHWAAIRLVEVGEVRIIRPELHRD